MTLDAYGKKAESAMGSDTTMRNANRYDVIVLGLGGMGSAALYHLARRGLKVCGVEQYHVAHDRGSSHGNLRVIRKAYFEHPDYVPLLERAYHLWEELELESGESLLVKNGLILAGSPQSDTIAGLETCYRNHALPREVWNADDARRKMPWFHLPDDCVVFHDPLGGYLFVERCVTQHLALAERHGARLILNAPAHAWKASQAAASVVTDSEEIFADALVLTLGPWAPEALADAGIPLRVLRKVQLWYRCQDVTPYQRPDFPCFYIERDYGAFYGFPAVGEDGMKVAEHSGGQEIDGPHELDRGLHEQDEAGPRRFLYETFGAADFELARFSVCMYTSSIDGDFIVDRHPKHPRVVFAAGFSGHGFKFASVTGEVLADLAEGRPPSQPIAFLGLNRFQTV